MEIQSIPFTAVVEYFNIYGLADFDEFLYIIRRMDNSFLEMNEENNKSERGNNATKHTDKKDNSKG